MALDLTGGPAPIWPQEVSPVSGVILCYDATRSETLTGLSEALGEYSYPLLSGGGRIGPARNVWADTDRPSSAMPRRARRPARVQV
jgi:hypothetical protein